MGVGGVLVVIVLLVVGACSDDDGQVEAGGVTSTLTEAPVAELNGSSLTTEDSCGESFTVRDSGGTRRLTIVPDSAAREGSDPGVFALGEDGWTGELEVGAGLLVWSCHDIGTDFERERVDEIWTVIGGSVELLDPIPADIDSGGTGTVRAHIVEVIIEGSTGITARVPDIALVNHEWGFYGG